MTPPGGSLAAGCGRRGRAALPLLACALAPSCATPTPPHPPNLLVLDVESFRADHLDATGPDGTPLAPTLAALAARGVVFEAAFAQSGITYSGLAALLTGRHPLPLADMQRRFTAQISGEGVPVLPEVLGLYGYHTAVFWGNTMPVENPAFSKGFRDVQISAAGEGPRSYEDPVVGWIAHATPPFFALVHNYDLHGPQLGVPEGVIPSDARVGDARGSLTTRYVACAQAHGPERARALVRETYGAYLAWYDARIAAFLEALDRAGHREDTVVVVTSNHGEDLLEHLDAPGHNVLYDTVLRIPMVWVEPPGGDRPPPARRRETVQTVDLTASLLDRAGAVLPAGLQGRSFLPLVRGIATNWEERDVLALTDVWNAAVRRGPHKLLRCRQPVYPPRADADPSRVEWFELYDLSVDPGEREDLFDQRPDLGLPLAGRLLDWQAGQAAQATSAGFTPQEHERLRQALRDRGYWQVAP